MKFSENSDQAANYLRQAVPKMVKHSIVPNPLNYTLWYSYFSKDFPLLNKELDQTIERLGTCPPAIGESLFLQHIGQLDENNEEHLVTFQEALSHLVSDLSDSLDHTAKQTNSYSEALKDNLTELGSHGIDDAVAPVLNELSANVSAICSSNEEFQGKLTAAQAEINVLKTELENSKKEASTDPLTGLYNRRMFESIYHQFVDDSNDNDEIALVMMDIDKFKVFNDTHGHLMGDQILKFIGKLLIKECEEPVVPVRLGGEEFVLLCPYLNLKQAYDIAENIRTKLAGVLFSSKKTGQKIPPVTASFGVALKKPEEFLKQIIERADEALYAAKDAGRNQVMMAS
jgi:diguanylate cyclase